MVCSGRGATTGGGVSSSSSSPSLPPDAEVAVPCLPGCNGTREQLRKCTLTEFYLQGVYDLIHSPTGSLYLKEQSEGNRSECVRQQPWLCVSLPADTKLTCGREAEVFLFPTGGVVELEDVEDGLRILLLL